MKLRRRAVLLSLAAAGLSGCVSPVAPNTDKLSMPDEVVFLWSEGPPGGVPPGLSEQIVHRDNPFGLLDRAAHEVTAPSLSIFRPTVPDGSAILVIPGGGYKWVVVDKEGFEGARHFGGQGATVYVLRYRLPHQGWAAGASAPLQDAQRAVRLIRARAAADGIDPARVTVIGFSAGGHLAGLLATGFDAPIHAPQDVVDSSSARPDGVVLVYPVATMARPFAHEGSRLNLIGSDPTPEQEAAWSLEHRIRPDMPPLFLMHAADDAAVPVENALVLYEALRRAEVPAALHVFEAGGHGFGLRGIAGTPLEDWPGMVTRWGRDKGLFLSSIG
ncbi:alpha/beta hydrolase [Hyphomonas sp.]|uniref:alpha/beta hydrolase n=1 Tax=Hyphomonas sp. TaxID=87 RepID=UPI0025BB9505|nr:alpha/beta hydrolase [Hyphomonas sp.]